MSSKSPLFDPLDPSEQSGSLWDSFVAVLPSQPAAQTTSATPAPSPVVLPDESYEAQAAVSSSGSGGPGSVVAVTSAGLTINLIFDAAAMAAPASFRAGIQQAAALLSGAITDKITLNFQIDYSGTGGGAAAGPDSGQWVSYSTVRGDLLNNASPGDATFNALPAGSSIQGQSNVAVWNAQLKLWGLLGANDTTTDDGSATFATDINPNLLVGVALHELTHAMGRVPYGPQPDIFDLFRFTGPGARLFTDNIPANASYLSLDGGATKLADFGQNSDPSDFLNSGVQGANDPFNEYYSSNTLQQLTAIDLKQLDALGYHLASQGPVVIQTDGNTSLVQIGSNYFLNPVGGGTGPELYYGGAPVTVGMWSGWAPIGAIQTAGGYDIAWKNIGTGQFNIWSTDSSAHYSTNLLSLVSGSNPALESYENTFHQDLNGDGAIGIQAVVLQTDLTTSLVQAEGNYFLESSGGWTGPELSIGGAPVTVGMWPGWAPVGAVQTSGGYDVAWKNAGTGQFNIWSTDGSGNYITNLVSLVSATSSVLSAYESVFHQDLNGDGTIGGSTVVIQTDGSTSLVQNGIDYFLNPAGGGTGPELYFGGAPVAVGMWSGWAPIGAVQVASGYDVAWKNAGTGQFNVWSTDSTGHYLANLLSFAGATSTALESYETTFQQDLNGDGTIGIPTVLIQTDGSTSLVQTGLNYFLDPVGGGSGPELYFMGAPVTAGMWAGWAPIGAVQTSGGYDVAWKNAGTGQFNIWSTDSSGHYIANLLSMATATSTALESYESTFQQDLNGDGTIGISSAVIHTDGSTSLVQVASNYFLNPAGGGSGPELYFGGAPVTVGMWAGWAPIGAIQTAGGYDVAWKNAGTGQFNIWSTDSSGHYITNLLSFAAGTSSALEAYEVTFHQDLNGDGTIGVPAATAPAAASAAQTTFDGNTLTLAAPSNFSGQLLGFGGDGTLSGSDRVDLRGFDFNTLHSSYDGASGTLSLSSGSNTASLQFLGQYAQDSFHFADDGHGGTVVVGATPSAQAAVAAEVSTSAAHDSFVFAANFGNVTLPNFAPATDTLQFNKAIFANVTALLAATHDDGAGNAVITDAAHDTITLQHVTTAQLAAHQSDFHFV